MQRRCVHDEYGRVDPVKAQERSKPRGTNSAKRARPNDEDVFPFSKKPKQESTSPTTRPARLGGEGDVSNAPVAHTDETQPSGQENKGFSQVEAEEKAFGQNSYASPPAFQTDAEETRVNPGPAPQPTASLVSPPTSLSDETDLPHEHANGEVHEGTVLHTPNSSSRHSSRQPRQAERYAGFKPVPHVHPRPAPSHKPPVLSGGVKKSTSRPTSSHKKSTPGAEKRHDNPISPGQSGKRVKLDDMHLTDGADEETMRLIQQIQGEEFGLRRRGGRA